MGKLILVRGVPGSGKSTFVNTNKRCCDDHIEADMFFIRPNGVYDFNPRMLKDAHDWCFGQAAWAMCSEGDVYVSNTFTRAWEMQKYINLAKHHSAELIVYRCTGNFDNVHGVPSDKVQQMKERFEDYDGEIYV